MAPLQIVDYGRLLLGERQERQKLRNICETSGIFFLDMTSTDVFEYLRDVYEAESRYFGQRLDTKQIDTIPGMERGFKQYPGSSTYELTTGSIPQGSGDKWWPSELQRAGISLQRLSSACDKACRLMHAQLTESLALADPTPMQPSFHASRVEQTGLKLCQKDASNNDDQTAGKEHTDGGLLTLLFYDQPTLQVADHLDTNAWTVVDPRPGLVVVNVADELQKRSGGALKSPLHRVIQPAGACKDRYSAVYFLRPE